MPCWQCSAIFGSKWLLEILKVGLALASYDACDECGHLNPER